MPQSNVTSGSADSCATIAARRLERFVSAEQGGMSTRLGGVGAWRVRSNSAVFLRSRDRGSEDAVVFPRIGGDGYFDHRGSMIGSSGSSADSRRLFVHAISSLIGLS